MKNFAKNLAALVKVKTIVTLVVIVIFAVLALRGDIAPDNVMVIVSTVIAFYFGTQHEKSNTEQITAEHISSCPFVVGEGTEEEYIEGEPIETETEITEEGAEAE